MHTFYLRMSIFSFLLTLICCSTFSAHAFARQASPYAQKEARVKPLEQFAQYTSIAGPSSLRCGGVDWIAYTGVNDQIYLLNADTNVQNKLGETSQTSPALSCLANGKIAIAWIGVSDTTIRAGVVGDCDCLVFYVTTAYHTDGTAPALAQETDANGNTDLAYVGTDHYIYLGSSSNGQAYSVQRDSSDYTRAGAGVALDYSATTSKVYATWLAASGTPRLIIGTWDLNLAAYDTSHLNDSWSPDYSTIHAGISALNDTQGNLAIIFKEARSKHLRTGYWNESSGTWSASTYQAAYLSPFAPTTYGTQDAYTGTNNELYWEDITIW